MSPVCVPGILLLNRGKARLARRVLSIGAGYDFRRDGFHYATIRGVSYKRRSRRNPADADKGNVISGAAAQAVVLDDVGDMFPNPVPLQPTIPMNSLLNALLFHSHPT